MKPPQYNDRLPKVIAVDLDGTILQPVWDVPGTTIHNYEGKFGEVMPLAREALNVLWVWGYKIVIWTTRTDTVAVRRYLVNNKIPFDTINKNIPEVVKLFGWSNRIPIGTQIMVETAKGPELFERGEPRKIYYTHLIDDRAGFSGDWSVELKKYKPVCELDIMGRSIEDRELLYKSLSSLSGDTPTV